jgi:diguanylate cyclase (GGDEF)-like protein
MTGIGVIHRRPRARLRYGIRSHLAAGLSLLVVQIFGPWWAQAPSSLMIMGLGLIALHVGPRRHLPPADRGPWHCILLAAYLFVIASVIRAAVPGTMATPPTPIALIPNAFVIPAYLLIGYAFISMLRRRRATEDDPAQIDAILVALAATFLTWTFVITPAMAVADLSPMGIVDAVFPIIDVVLLVLVAQLMLADGARQPALWLLVLAAVAMFAGDVLFTVRDAELVGISQQSLDSIYMLMMVLLPAAALHPSVRTLTEPQRIEVCPLSRLRIALIALVLVVSTVTATLMPYGSLLHDLVRATLCALLVLAVLARVVRSSNSRARAEQLNRWRATHDALTDLPNRELLAETVGRWADRAADERLEISLLFLDLDRFKMVNDNWGHQVGDELLCAVAARLGEQVRGDHLVCRISGDEFVVALTGPAHLRLAESLADRLLAEFARPLRLSIGDLVISASIGIAKSHGSALPLELIRDADTAMYKAKDSGRNAYAMFDTTLRKQVRDRVELEQALRGALDRGELAVYFQPIIDLATGELDGFEALMRWHSPELGFVGPMEFIPIAEETGMIVEMGSWLLRESARQLTAWTTERGPDARPLHVSVNVAVRQLRDGSLVSVADQVLRDTGLPASALWLEITESGVMEDIDAALLTLHALRALGVTLCIDDFGTGYSSLSYLHRLPVGIVKIDRSFVNDCGGQGPNEPIVRAVLAMTHAMGHRVVAEGVETEVQRDWLREQGCDLVQGWLYGKAEPSERLGDWIHRRIVPV